MPGPLRGSSASWSPFLFCQKGEKALPIPATPAEMGNDKHRENAMKLEGGCYCGKVRYVAEGEPIMKAQWHCRECQYLTGGAPNMLMV
jgi:hypothetical protein